LWRWEGSEVSRYPLVVFLLCLSIIASPIAIRASQTAPATNLGKGPAWIISKIDPPQKTAARGQQITFAIELTNLTRSHYQRVEVSLIPAVSGHSGWFAVKPFLLENVGSQQGFRARVSITPTYQAPLGMHTFFTSIKAPGYPPCIIKQGPRLQVTKTKEEPSLQSIVHREVLITVRAKMGALQSLFDQLRRSYRLEVTETTELTSLGKSLIRLRIPDDRTVEEVMEALSQDPCKILPQPNYLYRTAGTKADPLRDLQYAFKALNAERLPSEINGKGVKIALIDTGLDYLHQDLQARIAQKKDIVGKGLFRRDLHGTALAGIIAACCNNGVGICGLAPQAEIIAIKACCPIAEEKMTATTSSFWLSQGIDYAILQKVRVINLSLGGPKDPLIAELIQEAFARGIVIVAAAGDKSLSNYPPYPAAIDEVIAVAAVDINKKAYSEGIQGDFIDLCAPGVDIMTTAPGDKYNCYSGTSMAAAYVTAAVALLLQRRPDLKPKQVRSLLEQSARDLGAPGKDKQFGCGLLDLKRLLD
jgi:subtilisin family serine protease